jgi:hypothetical protein
VSVEQWFSIEVFDGSYAASLWAESVGDSLTESALGFGAMNWSWHAHTWGVVFEVRFGDEASWDRWRESPAMVAALDAVPDPVSGLILYKGRGGSSGRVEPRRPRPLSGSGAAALPLPDELFLPEDWRTCGSESLRYVLQTR